MSSNEQQTISDLHAELSSLKEEIKEAKQERMAAMSNLENAVGVDTKSQKLLDSASANLTGLQNKELALLELIFRLTHHPAPNKENLDLESSTNLISSILASNMTYHDKESILTDMMQSKDKEIFSKDSLLALNLVELKRVRGERDYLKSNLDARFIIESYEADLPSSYKDRNTEKMVAISRKEKWAKHLKQNPGIAQELKACDAQVDWVLKVAEIYENLSRNIHKRTLDVGEGSYLVYIRKGLPKQ